MNKIKIRFLLILVLFFISFYLQSCANVIFNKEYKNENELVQHLEKYPVLGFLYLDKIEIYKAFLSIKEKENNFPLFTISGSIIYKNNISFVGYTNIGKNQIQVFSLLYDFQNHSGLFDDYFSKTRYEINSNSTKIPKNLISYFERNCFLLMLILKDNHIDGTKNGDIQIEDIIYTIKEYRIEKARLDSNTLSIKVEYLNYKNWGNFYYPSVININYQDYFINLLIIDAKFQLKFN